MGLSYSLAGSTNTNVKLDFGIATSESVYPIKSLPIPNGTPGLFKILYNPSNKLFTKPEEVANDTFMTYLSILAKSPPIALAQPEFCAMTFTKDQPVGDVWWLSTDFVDSKYANLNGSHVRVMLTGEPKAGGALSIAPQNVTPYPNTNQRWSLCYATDGRSTKNAIVLNPIKPPVNTPYPEVPFCVCVKNGLTETQPALLPGQVYDVSVFDLQPLFIDGPMYRINPRCGSFALKYAAYWQEPYIKNSIYPNLTSRLNSWIYFNRNWRNFYGVQASVQPVDWSPILPDAEVKKSKFPEVKKSKLPDAEVKKSRFSDAEVKKLRLPDAEVQKSRLQSKLTWWQDTLQNPLRLYGVFLQAMIQNACVGIWFGLRLKTGI